MGDVQKMLASLGGNHAPRNMADTSDPGVSLPPLPSLAMALDPINQSIGGQGFAMADPGIQLAPQQAPSSQPVFSAPQNTTAPVDNPYVEDTPKELAGNKGEDVTVTGDDFIPKKESTIARIADIFLHGIFERRTNNANLIEAMKGYDRDPESAIRRVNKFDPGAAQRLRESNERMEANRILQEERIQALREKGFDRLSGMVGAITNSKKPDEAYTQVLPTLRAYANQYHLDGDNMFPDKYDPGKVGAIRQGGLTAYQQEALKNQDETQARLDKNMEVDNAETKRYHDAQLELTKERLGIAQQNANKKSGTARSIFSADRGGEAVGTLSPDGKLAALRGSDGQWYAYRLQTPGDITSRKRSPGDDDALRAKMKKAGGN